MVGSWLRGMAIHDIDQALAIADRVSLLYQGRLVMTVTPPSLAHGGLIQQVFP